MNARPSLKRSIVFLLVPDFSMIAFATAIEPLRLANRMLGYESYRWRLASADGKPVSASNGVTIAVELLARRRAAHADGRRQAVDDFRLLRH